MADGADPAMPTHIQTDTRSGLANALLRTAPNLRTAPKKSFTVFIDLSARCYW